MHFSSRAAAVVAVSALLVGAAACSDPLSVENVNNPDRTRIFGLSRDVESLASRLYQNVHTATVGNTGLTGSDGLYQQMLTMGLENASSLNNYGMGPRSSIPRVFIDNTIGNNFSVGNRRDFRDLQIAARTATRVLESVNSTGFTLNDTTSDRRLRAFAWFSYATALGNGALAYDSLGVPLPGEADAFEPPLVGADSVMRAALTALDSAQANSQGTAGTFTIPATWLAQDGAMTRADFVRLIRSYKARFRAQVARTPQERAAVNWTQVVADAQNGITTDFQININTSGGWDYAWLAQHHTTGEATWHQMVQLVVGMADTTRVGGVPQYDTWLQIQRDVREPFLIVTSDLRFPQGTTRAAQQTNSPATAMRAGQYIRNRPTGDDAANTGWNTGFYSHNRWRAIQLNGRSSGKWTTYSKGENDMYAAEGLMRLNRTSDAIPLINASRATAGLPAIPGGTGRDESIPGPSCVPRVPDPAQGYVRTKCGSPFEAMKWESRMESAYASYGAWYFNGRGWGDLPEGTALFWPTPWQELAARSKPIYSVGGVGNYGGAAASTTYGFGSGNR
jgi:hypothetical protein